MKRMLQVCKYASMQVEPNTNYADIRLRVVVYCPSEHAWEIVWNYQKYQYIPVAHIRSISLESSILTVWKDCHSRNGRVQNYQYLEMNNIYHNGEELFSGYNRERGTRLSVIFLGQHQYFSIKLPKAQRPNLNHI